jgi:hypothetical protein
MRLRGFVALALAGVLVAGCQTGAERARPAADSQDLAAIPVDDNDQRLIGMTPPALLAELGAPPVTRVEAPAEVWQYAGEGCVLDIFLYDQGAGQTVVHYEARDSASAQVTDARRCFAELLRRKKAGLVG